LGTHGTPDLRSNVECEILTVQDVRLVFEGDGIIIQPEGYLLGPLRRRGDVRARKTLATIDYKKTSVKAIAWYTAQGDRDA
jgi:hypothetical protein